MTPRDQLVTRLGLSAAVALLAALGASEGRIYVAKPDVGGIPTVCDGITGPDVVPGRRYTDQECDYLIAKHADYHAARVLQCVHVPLDDGEKVAWVHFAYNVGSEAFCQSTAAKLLNEGRRDQACDQLRNWYRAGGKDCRDRANNCHGLIDRRAREHAWCDGALPIPSVWANVESGSDIAP